MARTYPGIFSLIAIAGGIMLADILRLPGWIFLFAALTALLSAGAVLIIRRHTIATILFGFVLAGLSASHFARDAYDFGSQHVGGYADADTRYRILGHIDDWPDLRRDRIDITVRLDSLGLDYMVPASGRILLKVADTGAAVQYGDRVEFYARLYPITGSGGEAASYSRSLYLKGIHAVAYIRSRSDLRRQARSPIGLIPIVDTIRTGISHSLSRTLHPDAAALAGGFLIGETRDIPNDIYRAFRDTGTLHLLAVSGSNVTLVIGFVIILLRPFRTGRLRRTLLLLVALLLFALLCRGEPSVIRASVMAALVLLARLVGRRINLNNIIALAAAGILLITPTQLFNVGFQLSFATAWGLVFITPKVYHLTDRKSFGPFRRYLLLAVIVSLTAQLFSTPLIAYYFQRVPLLTTFANLVIVPLVSGAVIGILITLVIDFVWPPLAVFSGTLLNSLIDVILYSLRQFSGPRALLIDTGEISIAAVVLAYTFLTLVGWSLVAAQFRRWVLIGTLALVNVGLVHVVFAVPTAPPAMTIHINRVPGGIAAVVTPADHPRSDLIITGLATRDYPVADRVLLPWLERLGATRLDRVVLLAADYVAAAGLARLADSLGADTLYIHRRLRATVTDIAAASRPAPPWLPFGDTARSIGSGLFLREWGALLALDHAEVAFIRTDADLTAIASRPTGPVRWLIYGDEVEAANLAPFASSLTGVVCAESDHGESFPPNPTVVDLRHTGALSLQLYPDSAHPVQLHLPD